jgi:hypothetical protein
MSSSPHLREPIIVDLQHIILRLGELLHEGPDVMEGCLIQD